MEPAGPAPGRLGPLLCLLLTASCAWSGKHPPLPTAALPKLRAQASQTSTGTHSANAEQ